MPQLFPYQLDAVSCAVQMCHPDLESRGYIFAFEMGCGKTAAALETVRRLVGKALGDSHILIVCPALVRLNWKDEIQKWAGDFITPENIGLIDVGRRRKLGKKASMRREAAYAQPIQIVSYNLLNEVRKGPWDIIILDEVHKIKGVSTQQSREARVLRGANPRAAILGLTATLAPNHPLDVWNPIHTIWPGRLGWPSKRDLQKGRCPWSFAQRYSVFVRNQYGGAFKGVNPAHMDELAQILRSLSSRVTKAEIAHLLPPFTIQTLRVNPRTEQLRRQNKIERVSSVSNLQASLDACGVEKIPLAVSWAEDTAEDTTHCAILTHLKSTATEIASRLEFKGYQVVHVDGALPAGPRVQQIQRAIEMPKCILVATMHSVGIGIDLTRFSQALFAELYYRPETVEQALGRFSRLSGTVPSNCTIMVLEGTKEEIVTEKLLQKIADVNTIIQAGQSVENFESAMAHGKLDDELLDELNELISNMEELDE